MNQALTNIVIRGVVTTTAMTHQESPDKKGGQMLGPVFCKNVRYEVPYITANSVRGLLRRAAAKHLLQKLEELIAAGKTGYSFISRDLYLSIVRGAYARTAISPNGPTFEQAAAAYTHVFAGLFGGGSRMHESRFRLERDLFPVLDITKGLMPVDVQGEALTAWPKDLLASTLMAPRDDFERIPQENVVADLQNAYNEHMATKLVQKDVQEPSVDGVKPDGKTKDDLNGFTKIECIVPGVPLYFGLDVPNITDAQAGMVLMAIKTWINRNALGGGSQRGRGAFLPKLALYENGQSVAQNLFFGDAPNGALARHSRIAEMLDAMDRELEGAANPDLLLSIYPDDIKSKAGADKPKSISKGKQAALTTAGA